MSPTMINEKMLDHEVNALTAHESDALDGFQPVGGLLVIPLSEVDATVFQNRLQEEKDKATVIAGGVRDAKRRIMATKGPQRKQKPQVKTEGSQGNGDESE